MIGQPKVYSSYLVQPRVQADRATQWKGFRTQFYEVKRSNPHLLRNTLGIMVVWVSVIASVQSMTASTPATAQLATIPAAASGTAPAADAVASTVQAPAPAPAQVASAAAPAAAPAAPVVRPASLATGPSGQALPAGTMAPFGTYRNGYTWGNCTWYVASRRQVPHNWGNAKTWYYRAAASGWKVGSTPAVAAIAWTGAGYYGHVALVEQVSPDGRQVLISEMNYRGLGVRSSRWAPASSFRYIY